MSFFTLSTGQKAAPTTEFDSNVELAPIPDGTIVTAVIENAEISAWEDDQYINLRWRVAQPQEFNNRVVFQKIRVWDGNPSKRDRAIQMLVAIDQNCGGHLLASGQEPTDQSLQTLVSRPLRLKLGVWELDDKSRSGNWVVSVGPASAQAVAQAATPPPVMADDDIPF